MIRPLPTVSFTRVLAGVLTSVLISMLIPVFSTAAPVLADAVGAAPTVADARDPGTLSLPDYLTKLKGLEQLVASCQHSISPATCASSEVGADVRVTLPAGSRQIRFGWLRSLLDQAAHPEAAPEASPAADRPDFGSKPSEPKPASNQAQQPAKTDPNTQSESGKRLPILSPLDTLPDATPPNLLKRLDDARLRLQQDEKLATDYESAANATVAGSTSKGSSQGPSADAQHRLLTQILAAKEYHAEAAKRSIKDRILEKIAKWINRIIDKLVDAGSKSRWIGATAEFIFIALLLLALVWFLIRLERQGRLGSALYNLGPGTGAASARGWQLWLQDAKIAAAQGAWREAIHLTYWASISRLESSGLWPADRARTPREYLALLSDENTHRAGLTALTRSFERTWYAGRPADEADFLQAEQLASRMGANSGSGTKAETATIPAFRPDLR